MIRENILGNIAIARNKGLNSITVLHLEDVHPFSYGLWRRVAQQVASEQGFVVDFMHAGEFVAAAISNPALINKRVFAADNLLGDICADAVAACVGGMGIPATDQFNTDGTTNKHFFEPLHGSAPDIAKQGKANPTATLLTAAEIFRAYGFTSLHLAAHQALYSVIDSGLHTFDMPGAKITATTQEFGDAVISQFLNQS